MIYSVWNQGAGLFDYYETNAQQTQLNVEKPSHLGNRTLGSTVDQAAWPLPPAARKTGQGQIPVGRIATRKRAGALGAVADNLSLVKIGLLISAAYLAVKTLGPKRRRTR
jgi:hypothetical protein